LIAEVPKNEGYKSMSKADALKSAQRAKALRNLPNLTTAPSWAEAKKAEQALKEAIQKKAPDVKAKEAALSALMEKVYQEAGAWDLLG
jgi:hypothetical protein